ncbi:MAG: hypothetical protein KDD40_11660, partial [Bdellovibrionales bacterium]|nr:hypothetical protein [Bdellovibrionales bacterium]
IGYIAALDRSYLILLDTQKLLSDCLWTVLLKGDAFANASLFKALNQNNTKSGHEWLLVLQQTDVDIEKVYSRINKITKNQVFTNEIVESFRRVMFDKVQLQDELDGPHDFSTYLPSYPWDVLSYELSKLKYQSPSVFEYLFILAASKQKNNGSIF